jgi:hypothetical protein
MRAILVILVTSFWMVAPTTGQTNVRRDERCTIWQRLEECHDFELKRRVPGLIRELDAMAERIPDLAPRCHYECARLELMLDRPTRALTRFRHAMQHLQDAYGQRAALAHARLAGQSGQYAAAMRTLHTLAHHRRLEGGPLRVGIADIQVEAARLHLRAGSPGRALTCLERARVVGHSGPGQPRDRELALEYEIAYLEGQALEANGALAAASRTYWRHLDENPDGCARDPRVPLALVRAFQIRGDLDRLRVELSRRSRQSKTLTVAVTLLDYLDFKAMVDAGNVPGLLSELEGVDPPIWKDRDGLDWHYFQAARDLVAKRAAWARSAVLAHMEQYGPFTIGVYILGLVGDEEALRVLYRMAIEATSHRDLKNITTAIARSRRELAVKLLERLQRDTSAAHPAELRRAAQFALQSFPPVGQSIH